MKHDCYQGPWKKRLSTIYGETQVSIDWMIRESYHWNFKGYERPIVIRQRRNINLIPSVDWQVITSEGGKKTFICSDNPNYPYWPYYRWYIAYG